MYEYRKILRLYIQQSVGGCGTSLDNTPRYVRIEVTREVRAHWCIRDHETRDSGCKTKNCRRSSRFCWGRIRKVFSTHANSDNEGYENGN